MKRLISSIVSVFILSFLMNFFWESMHGYSLYTDHVIDSDKYVRMMVYMSFMDAVTILAMYLVFAFFKKDILWLKRLSCKEAIVFFILGLFVGTAAEYWAVHVSHEWHYNQYMPVIFGIGLSPLLQLSSTGLAAIWLTKGIDE